MNSQPTAASLRAAEQIIKQLAILSLKDTKSKIARLIDAAGMAEAVDVIRELIDAMLSVAGWSLNFDKTTGKELPMTRSKEVETAEANARALLAKLTT